MIMVQEEGVFGRISYINAQVFPGRDMFQGCLATMGGSDVIPSEQIKITYLYLVWSCACVHGVRLFRGQRKKKRARGYMKLFPSWVTKLGLHVGSDWRFYYESMNPSRESGRSRQSNLGWQPRYSFAELKHVKLHLHTLMDRDNNCRA